MTAAERSTGRGAWNARRLCALAGAGALAGLVGLTSVAAAQESPAFEALPESIERYTEKRSDCFLDGEKQDFDAWIDQARIAVPGCEKPIIPPRETVQSYKAYKPKSGHTIDCASLRANESNTRYLDTFLDDFVRQTEAAGKGSRPAAICAANMIHAWSAAGAMTKLGDDGFERQSLYAIMWTYGGLSAAYFNNPAVQAAARGIPDGGGTADDAILSWFAALAKPISAAIDEDRAAKHEDNIQYWRGFSILPTALMTEDPALLSQSRKVFGTAITAITANKTDPADDGYLPRELERGDKALSYHAYAIQPLLGMSVMSRAYGCDFLDSARKKERLASLLTRTIEGTYQPKIFSQHLTRGKPVKQTENAGVGIRSMLYLVDALDPAMYREIDAEAAAFLGKTPPLVPLDETKQKPNARLGGTFDAMLRGAAERPPPPPAALAKACGAKD